MHNLRLEAHPVPLHTTPSDSFYREPKRGDTLNSGAERVPAGRAGEEDRAPWLDMKGSWRTKEEKEATGIRRENKLTTLFKEPQTLSTEHQRFWGALVKMEMRAPCDSLISYLARTGERDKAVVLPRGFPQSIATLRRTKTTTGCPG